MESSARALAARAPVAVGVSAALTYSSSSIGRLVVSLRGSTSPAARPLRCSASSLSAASSASSAWIRVDRSASDMGVAVGCQGEGRQGDPVSAASTVRRQQTRPATHLRVKIQSRTQGRSLLRLRAARRRRLSAGGAALPTCIGRQTLFRLRLALDDRPSRHRPPPSRPPLPPSHPPPSWLVRQHVRVRRARPFSPARSPARRRLTPPSRCSPYKLLGVTPPISTDPPKPADVNATKGLMNELLKQNQFESKEDGRLRYVPLSALHRRVVRQRRQWRRALEHALGRKALADLGQGQAGRPSVGGLCWRRPPDRFSLYHALQPVRPRSEQDSGFEERGRSRQLALLPNDARRSSRPRLDLLGLTPSCCPTSPPARRERLLGSILSLVKQFVYKASLSKGLSEQASREAGGKIFTFGSYRCARLLLLLALVDGLAGRADLPPPFCRAPASACTDRAPISIACASCPSTSARRTSSGSSRTCSRCSPTSARSPSVLFSSRGRLRTRARRD